MTITWKAADDVALLIVDPQNDFCPGGSLAVEDGDKVIPVINSLRDHFNKVYISQDFHPAGHKFFAPTHGKAPFSMIKTSFGEQVLWPDHCVIGTEGVKFHKDLIVKPSDKIIQKGTDINVHSYSAFLEDDKKTAPKFPNGETLTDTMRKDGIKTIVMTGLALDYCVGDSALDALTDKFNVIVIEDATRSITPEARLAKIAAIVDKGGIVMTSEALQRHPQLIAA